MTTARSKVTFLGGAPEAQRLSGVHSIELAEGLYRGLSLTRLQDELVKTFRRELTPPACGANLN